jgi:murein DD-endopeptidase MepM/ murein hydrolase activator NlpD
MRAAAVIVAALVLAPAATAAASSRVAALQVALRSKGVYGGLIDGVAGPATEQAVRRFQRSRGLAVDGVAGPQTRRALGRRWRHELGSRTLSVGAAGWDVARLQFLLAWRGFPSGPLDGGFGQHVRAAVARFQRFCGLTADGAAGPATISSLLHMEAPSVPFAPAWPLRAPIGDRFGPRGGRFHTGIDLLAPSGTPVAAAASGRIAYAGLLGGGWGLLVVVKHHDGVRTFYAHLSRVDVHVGDRVRAGTRVGLVGATGDASGPHLHFEVRVRGAAVDPLSALH